MSNRPTSLIEQGAALSTPDPDQDDSLDILDIPDVWPDNVGNGATLCDHCQRFDIQSFARSASCRRGYVFREVKAAAADGCEFCSLLLDSVKDVERPTYFYTNNLGRRTTTNSDLYVHMTLSENYTDKKMQSASPGLRANRLLTEIEDRFSEVKNASEHELCLAADPG